MSIAAKLTIELDRPSRTYRAGDVIAGTVLAQIREVVMPESLSIELRWRTHGPGKTAAGKGIRVALLHSWPQRAWEGGQTYRYPFQFTAPPWPPTLEGNLVSIRWHLTARGSVGWRRVEAAREEVRLEAAAATPPAGRPRLRRGDSGRGTGQSLLLGLTFLLLGLGILGGTIKFASTALILWALGLGSAGVGGAFVFVAISNLLAEQRLGPVHTAVSRRAHPGGEVLLELRFAPPARIVINGIQATLIGEEAIEDNAEPPTTGKADILRDERVIRSAGVLGAREVVSETVRWAIPANAPFSFEADGNRVEWRVEVHIDVPHWPDWRLTLPVEVSPSRLGAPDLQLGLVSVTVQTGQRCPFCHEALAGTDAADLQTCVGCRAVLHRACLQEYGSCTTRGCRNNKREVDQARARRT